jgi:hypothetical protein
MYLCIDLRVSIHIHTHMHTYIQVGMLEISLCKISEGAIVGQTVTASMVTRVVAETDVEVCVHMYVCMCVCVCYSGTDSDGKHGD